jgi:hypothetical protein
MTPSTTIALGWTARFHCLSFMVDQMISSAPTSPRLWPRYGGTFGLLKDCTMSTTCVSRSTRHLPRAPVHGRGGMDGEWDGTKRTSTTVLGLARAIHGKSCSHVAGRNLMGRYICTYAVANVLYLAKEGFEEQGYISLSNLTRPFWQDLLGNRYHGEDELWIKNSEDHERNGMFETALKALVDTGDRFMRVGQAHAPEGWMSEQMDRLVPTSREQTENVS